MNIRFLGSCCAVTLALVTYSSGQSIIFDNFDGYADQAAFEAVWPAVGTVAPFSGILSTEQAVSFSNSIKIEGTATNNQYRNRRSFTESGVATLFDPIVFSIDFYDGAPTANPQRNCVNLQDGTTGLGTNQLISLGFNNNQSGANSGGQFYMARILGYTVVAADPDGGPDEGGTIGAGAFFKLNDFGVGGRSLGWHNLKVIISTDDGVSTDYAFYVDNVLAERVSNIGGAGTLRSYDNVTLGSGLSNGSTATYFDNVSVAVVPEPTSVGLLFFGAGCLGLRRRRAGV